MTLEQMADRNGRTEPGEETPAEAHKRGRREAIEEAVRHLRMHHHEHAANIVAKHEAEVVPRALRTPSHA